MKDSNINDIDYEITDTDQMTDDLINDLINTSKLNCWKLCFLYSSEIYKAIRHKHMIMNLNK